MKLSTLTWNIFEVPQASIN